MPTDSIILIALAVNFGIAILAYSVPRIRDGRARAAASTARELAPVVDPRPAGDAVDPGAPWFPGSNAPHHHDSAAGAAVATSDAATGLDTGPVWSRWLGEEEARIRRYHRPATIVLVELSGLERLADRLGIDAALRLLPPIAMTMRRELRAADHLARLGPTRFGAILNETDEVRAINYIERVRSACDVWLEAGAVMLRLSVGWAEITPDSPADVAFPEAERRLYEERQRIATLLSRQADEPDVEAAMFQTAKA
jgi:diguanylate cyclase (GGDEF)-like protein